MIITKAPTWLYSSHTRARGIIVKYILFLFCGLPAMCTGHGNEYVLIYLHVLAFFFP